MIIQRRKCNDGAISYCFRYVDEEFRSYINKDFRGTLDSIEDILALQHKIITETV